MHARGMRGMGESVDKVGSAGGCLSKALLCTRSDEYEGRLLRSVFHLAGSQGGGGPSREQTVNSCLMANKVLARQDPNQSADNESAKLMARIQHSRPQNAVHRAVGGESELGETCKAQWKENEKVRDRVPPLQKPTCLQNGTQRERGCSRATHCPASSDGLALRLRPIEQQRGQIDVKPVYCPHVCFGRKIPG